MAIARAFPDVKCNVLDLEQVINKVAAASDGAVQFIAGDMFESIPPADSGGQNLAQGLGPLHGLVHE
jgi:hypothetical protein